MNEKTTPFDWLKSISETKKNLLDHGHDIKEYIPFVVNKGLSYFPDSILYANEMNMRAHLSPRMQHDYLFHAIRPRARYSKWFKADAEEQKTIAAIAEYMQLSPRKVSQIMHLISDEQKEKMKESISGRV